MKFLKILLFCLVFVICYLLLYKVYILHQSRKYEQQDKSIKANTDKTQWVFVIVIFLVALYTYKSLAFGIIFGSAAYFIPKFYKDISIRIMKRKTLIDLLSVVESLSVQATANMPLKLILKNLPDVCKHEKFKDVMVDLNLEYQLTGFSLTNALRRLKEKFPYTEILMFSSALEQQSRGLNSDAAYDNLLHILRDKNIEYIENNTESKTVLLIIGVFIILINLLVMGCYPVIMEVNENLHTLLR